MGELHHSHYIMQIAQALYKIAKLDTKGGGNNLGKTRKRKLETRDKDYTPREDFTKPGQMIYDLKSRKCTTLIEKAQKSSRELENVP